MKMVRDLMKSLELELAEEKTRITEYKEGFEFLGYRFQKFKGNYKWPRAKAVIAFKDKVRFVTRRNQPRNVKQVIERLNPVVRGWGNYFKHGNCKKRFAELDSWTRMRLRSFIAKKKSYEMNYRYTNEYFQNLGLVSLTQLLSN